jgi:uncharacterized membrane protein
MRHFSIRPAITLRGRKFNGLRGWSGKPFHPPLTDIPVATYILAAGFDVASSIGGDDRRWAEELWHAATWVLVAGAATSVLTALTGFFDWWRSSTPGNQARRTINTHATIMLTVTALVLVNLAVRAAGYDDHESTPLAIAALSTLSAALVALGSTYGGTLVFDYGFNVETATDSPVWHADETDHLPGEPRS